MLRALTIVWIVILAAFIGLAIRASTGNVLPLDLSLARAVQDLPSPASLMFKTTNWLGDGIPLATVTLGAAAVLQIRRCSGRAVLMLFTFIARLGDVIVKVIVSEPRPSSHLVHVEIAPDNLSFPSGHVVGITLVFGLLVLFLPGMRLSKPVTVALQAIALFFIAVVGLGRISVGAHWPSDVAGGYLYAALFLIPVVIGMRLRKHDGRQSASSVG